MAEVFMLTCAGVVIYGHTSRHFVLITADGSDLACRSFHVDLAFPSSTARGKLICDMCDFRVVY